MQYLGCTYTKIYSLFIWDSNLTGYSIFYQSTLPIWRAMFEASWNSDLVIFLYNHSPNHVPPWDYFLSFFSKTIIYSYCSSGLRHRGHCDEWKWTVKLLNGKSRFKCVQLACTCKQCGFTETSREGSQWLEPGRVGPGSGVDLEMERDNCGPCRQGRETSWRQDLCCIHFALPHSLHSSWTVATIQILVD